MLNSRGLLIGVLALVTGAVVALDAFGVINGPINRALAQRTYADEATVPALPQSGQVVPVLNPSTTVKSPAPTTAGLTKALQRVLASPSLGKDVSVVIVDGQTGQQLYARKENKPQGPASTAKLITGIAALATLGSDTRISTQVVDNGSSITLVGGGDPTLASKPNRKAGTASIAELATTTASWLKRANRTSVVLTFDDSLFTGPTSAPTWPASYVASGIVAPVTALQVDRGKINPPSQARASDPSKLAGQRFAQALKARGIAVKGTVKRATAAAGAPVIASVQSPPITELVEVMLTESDDDVAEVLAHLAGARAGNGGSFAGGSATIQKVLDNFKISREGLVLFDGSGLSRSNAATPLTLAQVIYTSSRSKDRGLRSVLSGMPIAGLTGTLDDRYRTASTRAGGGVARGKTGTLTGVSSLAGTVVDRQGHPLVFVILADQLPAGGTLAARQGIDRVVATLAQCGCQ